MSGVAMFGLKFPSLLKFDEAKEELELKHNLRTLYHVEQAPSDTYMRERCDEVDPFEVRKAFKAVFSCMQRGKALEAFQYIDQHYLLAGDGTGFFSSDAVHCKNCCIKHYNQCHVKIQGHLSDNPSKYKKNTYILVKNSKHPWELYCSETTNNKIHSWLDYSFDLLQAFFSWIYTCLAALSNKISRTVIVPVYRFFQSKSTDETPLLPPPSRQV